MSKEIPLEASLISVREIFPSLLNSHSLSFKLQFYDQGLKDIPKNFIPPSDILVPLSNKDPIYLNDVVEAIDSGKNVKFKGTYEQIRIIHHYLIAVFDSLFNPKSFNKKLNELTIKIYKGDLIIDGKSSYKIDYRKGGMVYSRPAFEISKN